MQMKVRIGRWLLGLVMLFVFAGVLTAPQAKAADTHIAVSIGHAHHRHYYRHYYRHHYVVYYRHGRRYRSYR
jgi:hypothetical protein